MPKGKSSKPTPLGSWTHRDERVNIPTGELAEFVAEDETAPDWVRYPRDPSLSPQLVWVGKDDQDAEPLDVPAVPIYIQEKIHPQVIVENLRRTAEAGGQEPELTLFEDFDRLDFDELVDFYRHRQNWSNRLIVGDSLQVMASLSEKEGLRGQVQMIYLDPPYGIKFGSNWQVSTRDRDVKDGKDTDTTRQPEQIRAFRDTWELGIHSYLAYLRDRLVVARDLLTGSGSIFVQIGDENVHLVRSLMDEVFGSENFVSLITIRKTTGGNFTHLPGESDYVLFYGRDTDQLKFRQLYAPKENDKAARRYDQVLLADGDVRSATAEEKQGVVPTTDGRRFQLDNLTSDEYRPDTTVEFGFEGATFHPGATLHWKTSVDGLERLAGCGRLQPTGGGTLRYRRFLDDFPAKAIGNLWNDISGSVQSRSDPKVYVVQSSTSLVQRCMLMTTDPGDLILDPTCGSGTTGVVAEEWGRRWILVDTSRVAVALARTRLMGRKFPYYLLADSVEGKRREREIGGSAPLESHHATNDLRKGFVYKRIPHITLQSIAQNPDITEGMNREEIEAAIVRHGSSEVLVDQPYEDRKTVRVTGPFTVESLSPHRLLDPGSERSATEVAADQDPQAADFVTVILDNLRTAGVKTTTRGEQISFDLLEPFAGRAIAAEGRYTDATGEDKRVAICLGPEHGTVGQSLIREAAKEALRGFGFDILLVCGFAFDAHASATAEQITQEVDAVGDQPLMAAESRLGRLPVLLVRMNPDLAMGDTLLKKTGAGNLFMVFGEPDVTVKEEDDALTVELRGVDVYDPTTGEVRSNTTDDIACWFIDTAYDGESFFVRHAYFTGADDPYDRLKKALKSDIDADAWATLYRTTSRPFPRPKTGRIAVKVINHYGDEVLKVYDV